MSDFWSDPSSTSILHVCEQRWLWQDCTDAHGSFNKQHLWSFHLLTKGLYQKFYSIWCIFILIVSKLCTMQYTSIIRNITYTHFMYHFVCYWICCIWKSNKLNTTVFCSSKFLLFKLAGWCQTVIQRDGIFTLRLTTFMFLLHTICLPITFIHVLIMEKMLRTP